MGTGDGMVRNSTVHSRDGFAVRRAHMRARVGVVRQLIYVALTNGRLVRAVYQGAEAQVA